MPATVYVNIATRDGRIPDDVIVRVQTACVRAKRSGINAVMARSRDPYSVAACRNRGVATFLANPQFSHFLSVDDDVLLPEDGIVRLVELDGRRDAAISLGCYPTVRIPMNGPPFLYVAVMPKDRSGDAGWPRTWPTGDLECAGGGTGCMLIRRDVFGSLPFPWFVWTEHYDAAAAIVRATTDDMDFCSRARLVGFGVWADGLVRCGHLKEVDLRQFVPTEAVE